MVAAAADGNIVSVKQLVREGTDVDTRALDGWTPLTAAAREGRNEVIDELLTQGAEIDYPEGGGNTALFWASYYDHRSSVKLLLEKGANPTKKCNDCISPAQAAAERGHKEIAALLTESIASGR